MEEQRKSHKGLWVIGAVVVILLFCAFFFRVKKVSIEGNTYYSSREMEEKFQSNIFEKNILTFWLMQKLSLTPDLPFVREYEVNYPSTNEIHIKLYEKALWQELRIRTSIFTLIKMVLYCKARTKP